MEKPETRSPKAVWIGGATSTVLLAVFLFLKSQNSDVLSLPPVWLLVAVVPVTVGLIVGGYIHELKAGDYGLGFSNNKRLLKSQPISDSSAQNSLSISKAFPPEGWQSKRAEEYTRTRGYMLAHIYHVSREPGQKFDISVFVVKHQQGSSTPPRENLDEVKFVEFFFGESWGNEVFKVNGESGFFGVRTHAWGTFLATCKITFINDKVEPIVLYRYVDFSMANPPQ